MQTHWFADGLALYNYDCREVLPVLADASVDSVVTDPPYGLEFMGKEWDALGRDIGKAKNRGMGGIKEKGMVLPESYNADVNVRCRACGKWRKDHAPRRCSCAQPDFPNYRAHQAQIMQGWHHTWAAECFRVLKPGGYLLAFGGTRTYHRLASAIEDAGFEIRDSLHWLYGSGFPKSLDVSKAIDKARNDRPDILRVTSWLAAAAAARGISRAHVDAHMGTSDMGGWWLSRLGHRCAVPTWDQWQQLRALIGFGNEMDTEVWRLNGRKGTPGEAWGQREVIPGGIGSKTGSTYSADGGYIAGRAISTQGITPDATRWSGFGTALKPAHEPIVLARKPLTGTVAANVLAHGTGALNVDGCRVCGDQVPAGRWPPNVLLTHAADCDGECAPGCPVAGLDGQSGTLTSGKGPRHNTAAAHNRTASMGQTANDWVTAGHDESSSGGASRFFPQLNWSPEYDLPFLYQAKASAKERPRHADGTAHPTVKPLALMRWLARLVTPPGGTVLDPFCGTGTTLQAARLEGFRSIGCDSWDQAAEMACQRLGLVVEADAG